MSNEQQTLRDSEVMEECAKLCENIYSWSGAYSAGALCTHTLDAAAAAIRAKAKDQSRPLYSAPPLRYLSDEEIMDCWKCQKPIQFARAVLAKAREKPCYHK